MSEQFNLDVTIRSELGKGSSRRLRRFENRVPGIIYGGDQQPVTISMPAKDINKAVQSEAFYSHILTLNLDGQAVSVVLKDLQRHPARNDVIHADFQRVDASHKIHMQVPLHFLGETACVGVKTQGGKILHLVSEVAITCFPADLPEYLSVDLTNINVGTTLHLSDIPLPKGVELVELAHGGSHNQAIVTIAAARSSESDTTEASA